MAVAAAASQHEPVSVPSRQSYPLAHCPTFVPAGAHNLLAERVAPSAMVSGDPRTCD